MKSAITFSAVEQARGGPFVFWDDFARACDISRKLGFDALEVFAPRADYFRTTNIAKHLNDRGLKLAAVGTGAGWVVSKLSLSDPSTEVCNKAIDFVKSMIDVAAPANSQVIIGSMQGRADNAGELATRRTRLAQSLHQLAEYASSVNVRMLIEPLNRYETNLINSVDDGLNIISMSETSNLKLLCDVFHMNIEEVSIADSLAKAGAHLGHVHFADSNRKAVGFGHVEYTSIISALCKLNYAGYLSAEVLSQPDADTAADQTMIAYKALTQTS
jgi:sugar phosphate isomerase/epimerase